MRKRRRFWLAAVLVAALGAFVVFRLTSQQNEPSYDDKSLSDWVATMRDGPERLKARRIVHETGVTNWPFYVEWLQKDDRLTLRGRYLHFRKRTDGWMARFKLMEQRPESDYWDAKESYRALGLLALEELGHDGKAAIPDLIRLLATKGKNTNETSETAGAAYIILAKMSPESIAPLIQALSSTNEQAQKLSASALAGIGTNANAAIPIMETWLLDQRLFTRLQAAYVLGQIGGSPDEFMPVVVRSMRTNETDIAVLDYELGILREFKQEARSAIPILLAISTNTPDSKNSTNVFIRKLTLRALSEIDPETATKVGMR